LYLFLTQACFNLIKPLAATGPTQDLVVGTTTSNGFTILDKVTIEDFEGESQSLPFETQWSLDDTYSYSGTHSITNSLVDETSITSDLTLKIYVSDPSTVSCMAKIDIAMPYDYFALHINGDQRNSYHSKIDEWMPVITSIPPGENTIVFRVQHSNFDLPEDYPEREAVLHGVGQVWLDDCEVASQLVDSEPEAAGELFRFHYVLIRDNIVLYLF